LANLLKINFIILDYSVTNYKLRFLHGLLLGSLKTVGHIVEGLELRNGILGDASDLRLEVLQLGLIREAILEFSI